MDAPSDYDELSKKSNATSQEQAALVPWTGNTFYTIPAGSIIKASNGTQFIVTESVESRSLKEPFSVIKNDPVKYADFVNAGGWNGIKYLKVPVIQGQQVSNQIGQATGTRFECFTLDTLEVENASNVISCEFFNITVTPYKKQSGTDIIAGDSQVWEKIENIGMAGPYDKVFEVKILSDENKLLIKFGDGITGKLLPKDAIITINYLKTKGESGNIQSKFQLNSITLPNGQQMVDPRTNSVSNFICCTNISPVMGGKDIEDESDLKANAPISYLDYHAIASKKSYLKQIDSNSPVNLLHVNLYKSDTLNVDSYGTEEESPNNYISSVDDTGVLQEVFTDRKSLIVSALRSNGELIDDPENEVLVPLRQALDDYISPSDSLDFIQPNLIKVCPRITVSTASSILEKDIYDTLKPKIYSKYSIFSRGYNEKLFKSSIIDLVHNESFVKSVDCFLEAKTTASLRPTILTRAAQSGIDWLNYTGLTEEKMSLYDKNEIDLESLFSFSFKFDKIFAQDKTYLGFKNFKDGSPYLLKVNIIFKESPEDSRTLFLFDNRQSLNDDVSVNDAYYKHIDNSESIPNTETLSYGSTPIIWFNDFSENFKNSQVRVGQFVLQDKITSLNYMNQAKNFNDSPFEIRPLYIDENGKNKIFEKEDVPEDDRMSLSFDNSISTATCYRKNWQYWDHCKIDFTEDYSFPDSNDYASGQIIIPVRYILSSEEISSLKVLFKNVLSFSTQTEEIERLLKDKVSIEVFAITKQEVFECDNDNDIICVDKDDIMIEKKFIV